MSRLYVRREGAFSQSAIDDEIVLLNLADGTFFSMTGTAAEIWSLIDGSRSRAQLLDELAAAHDARPQAIAADLDSFLAQLLDAGFVAVV